MHYRPGLHILAEIYSNEIELLSHYTSVKKLFFDKIKQYGLNSLGEVFHSFPGGGYTGVICLTESHLAIHTWPEYGLVTFDVYLSNFKQDNDATTRGLFEDILTFFKPTKYTKKEVIR